MKRSLIFLLFAVGFLTACTSNNVVGAAGVTEAYIQAWADQDKAAITSYACNDWEEDAILAVDGLLSVESAATDISCEVTDENGDTASVACSGSLDLTYDGEVQSRSLSGRTFTLQKEDGQWRVCGFE